MHYNIAIRASSNRVTQGRKSKINGSVAEALIVFASR
jgi:hypothetical protein